MEQTGLAVGLATAGISAAVTAGLVRLLWPVLQRYALARPSARGLHKAPTPQGGGLAIMGAVIVVAAGAALLGWPGLSLPRLALVLSAATFMAALGWADDVFQLSPGLRLGLQLLTTGLVIFALPEQWRLLPEAVPLVAERLVLTVAGAWFVNLVNFMDGMDWMTVAQMVPLTAACAGFWLAGIIPPETGLAALALCGALIGFAPFNRPVARLFLGDVGSLSIGLLTGYCLLVLALSGALAAAVLLPLYYLADSGLTLLRRLLAGKKVWEAHREHFYQQAVLGGRSPLSVAAHVFALNLALAALAAASVAAKGAILPALCVAAGGGLVAFVMRRFARAG